MMSLAATDPQQHVRDIVKKVTAIATLPEVTARIISTVRNPQSTAAELHKIVAHDPALVTRILKIVNSAFYGLPGQIGSIERAIVLLGLNAVKNIAVAAGVGRLFRGPALGDAFAPQDLWTHSIAVAVASRALAAEVMPALAEEAFLAGLIHDVGLIVTLQGAPDDLDRVCRRVRQTGEEFCAVERDLTGFDHQMLGAALLEQWKFPRPCQLVAAYHHRPTSLGDDSRALVGIVALADTLCCAAGVGFTLTAAGQSLADMDQLGIGAAKIDRLRAALPGLIATAVEMFGQ